MMDYVGSCQSSHRVNLSQGEDTVCDLASACRGSTARPNCAGAVAFDKAKIERLRERWRLTKQGQIADLLTPLDLPPPARWRIDLPFQGGRARQRERVGVIGAVLMSPAKNRIDNVRRLGRAAT